MLNAKLPRANFRVLSIDIPLAHHTIGNDLTTMMKLAKALQVSTKFLSDDECDNPMEDIEKDGYIEEARIRYGSNGAKEVDALLAANKALFAGGELSDDQKERFFQAITEAYFACREEAKKKYGRKKSDNQQ